FAKAGGASTVPAEIEAVVLSCLAKNPADRPASAMDLAERYDVAMARANGELGPTPTASQEVTSEPTPVLVPTVPFDPQSVVHQMQAWMPDAIATYKLKGFVHDFQGQVVESVPGKIRVQLGGGNSPNGTHNPLAWLRFRKKAEFVEMGLRLERT